MGEKIYKGHKNINSYNIIPQKGLRLLKVIEGFFLKKNNTLMVLFIRKRKKVFSVILYIVGRIKNLLDFNGKLMIFNFFGYM